MKYQKGFLGDLMISLVFFGLLMLVYAYSMKHFADEAGKKVIIEETKFNADKSAIIINLNNTTNTRVSDINIACDVTMNSRTTKVGNATVFEILNPHEQRTFILKDLNEIIVEHDIPFNNYIYKAIPLSNIDKVACKVVHFENGKK